MYPIRARSVARSYSQNFWKRAELMCGQTNRALVGIIFCAQSTALHSSCSEQKTGKLSVHLSLHRKMIVAILHQQNAALWRPNSSNLKNSA